MNYDKEKTTTAEKDFAVYKKVRQIILKKFAGRDPFPPRDKKWARLLGWRNN